MSVGQGGPKQGTLLSFWRKKEEGGAQGKEDQLLGGRFSLLGGREELEAYQSRARWLVLAFSLPFLIIAGRLWQLQVTDEHDYNRKARSNLVRTVEIPADRGLIFDRHGRVVAENRVAYDVVVDPVHFRKEAAVLERLRGHLHLSQKGVDYIQRRLKRAGNRIFTAKRDISRDQVALLETHQMELPGVSVRTRSHRYYPYNELGAHTLGFMNEINAKELEKYRPYGYRPGDYVGRMGLERSSEAILRGSPGFKREVVDARGIPQSEDVAEELLGHYRRVEPIPGRNVVLTLDMQLQEIMLDAFAEHDSGAAVAIDPRDGSVLGLMSKPTFNPNSWSGRLSAEEKRRSDENPFKPMIDKTVKSYFPGSTFKLVSALAALNEGYIKPNETLRCDGFYEFGKRRFHCWNRMGHGTVSLTDSLKHSCDVYYYKLGEKLGIDMLAQYGYMFGFGERTGVGINGEQRGLVPTKDWHREHSPGGFQHGLTLSTSVGQGDTRVTPLQLAMAYGVLANRGTLYFPRLVDRVESAEGHRLFHYPKRVRSTLEVSDALLNNIDVGMTSVVEERGGTAFKHRLRYVTLAGKTGTAQVRGFDRMRLGADGEVILKHRDHSWFVAYGPVENPEIVIVVFVEHGGSGGKVAAPLAMKILDRYFREVQGLDPDAASPLVQGQTGPRRLARPQEGGQEPVRWRRPGSEGSAPSPARVMGAMPGAGEGAERRLRRPASSGAARPQEGAAAPASSPSAPSPSAPSPSAVPDSGSSPASGERQEGAPVAPGRADEASGEGAGSAP